MLKYTIPTIISRKHGTPRLANFCAIFQLVAVGQEKHKKNGVPYYIHIGYIGWYKTGR